MQIRPHFGNQQALQQQRRQNMELIEQQLAPEVPDAIKIMKEAKTRTSAPGDYRAYCASYGNAVVNSYLNAINAQTKTL